MAHRPVVLFITSGLAALNLLWNFACAHSLPAMPGAVEVPTWVWQNLQSLFETLRSV